MINMEADPSVDEGAGKKWIMAQNLGPLRLR